MVNSQRGFAWYELITTDVEAAKTFYTNVVGWDTLDGSVSGRTYILFTAEKSLVSGVMELPGDAKNMGGKPSWVGYVEVDDVDATANRIKSLGGAVHVPPTDMPNISRFSIFADPQAARLGLLRWLNPHREQPVQLEGPGRIGWHELLATESETALAFYGKLFGWQRADAYGGEIGTYQLFSVGGQNIGGVFTKPSTISIPFWLFYFNVGDLDAAALRVKTGGGQILEGPLEVPGGSLIVRCTDPQGAMFALQGKRNRHAIGYFEDMRGRRWSW